MPGDDFDSVARFVIDTFGDGGIVFVPELPDRGAPAAMIGRTLGVVPLPIDLQPAGWRLAPGEGIDQRRSRSLLAQDLDRLEELADGLEVTIKQQFAGPLTLAATVERPRGDKLLADHGARRELGEALAAGLSDHLVDLNRRFGQADLIVQIDEPAISAVLAGSVPTASGFGKHRTIEPPEADVLLGQLVSVVHAAGATAVLHSCAPVVPVGLIAGAGFDAISFDLKLAQFADEWAEVFEAGTDLWFGGGTAGQIEEFMDRLGFGIDVFAGRSVATPACGLANRTPPTARQELTQVGQTAASFG